MGGTTIETVANRQLIVRLFSVLVFVALAAGCAAVGDTRPAAQPVDGAGKAAGLSRAKRVFLYQSRVADALLDRYPLLEVFEQADPALIQAEAEMTASCGYLTEAVLAHLEGREPSLGLRLRVMTTVDACERAAQKIDVLLQAPVTGESI